LLARAFELLSAPLEGAPERLFRQARASAILASACGSFGLIGGQTEDIEAEGREVSAEALERIHRAKTGALLTACVQGGGVLAGASFEDEQRLRRFGGAIGLAFQVKDDILDATESAETLGKTAGKDTADRKATYVRLHGLAAARAKAESLLQQARAELRPFGERALLLDALARQIVERRA
jgi:geranylgeranyl diphosphate synthase type II